MNNYNPFYNPYFQQPMNTPAINQTFQLAQNNNEYEGRGANSIEEVKSTLALRPTMFINNQRTQLWIKEVAGNIKTYELKEVIELDEKDKKILELEDEIKKIKGMINNEQSSTNVNANATSEKSANGEPTTNGNE